MKTDKPAFNPDYDNIMSRHVIDEQDIASLRALEQCATDACMAAKEYRVIHGPVNWASFSCKDADLYLSTDRIGLRVYLSEASPDCHRLKKIRSRIPSRARVAGC